MKADGLQVMEVKLNMKEYKNIKVNEHKVARQ